MSTEQHKTQATEYEDMATAFDRFEGRLMKGSGVVHIARRGEPEVALCGRRNERRTRDYSPEIARRARRKLCRDCVSYHLRGDS